ncbi:hypothetical protein SAMN05421890_3525 [Ensifer adhaerens]|nr:hypothetical protein SAMN05421890_3525 [Ensifer adhaerens]
MFLEDELEYVRLKRNDNIMGWLAIVFVAVLVCMFAGLMNSASATGAGASAADMPHTATLDLQQPGLFSAPSSIGDRQMVLVQLDNAQAAARTDGVLSEIRPLPAAEVTAPAALLQNAVFQHDSGARMVDAVFEVHRGLTPLMSNPSSNLNPPHQTALADHDIISGLLLISSAVIGGSFILLAFGGPRGRHEDEDRLDVL